MLDIPQVIHTTDQLTAIIPLVVSRTEIRNVMGPGISEVLAALAAQNVSQAGPWFIHHLKPPGAEFDFEISVPVKTPVTAVGRVKPSQWPAMKVARAVYTGPYEGLGTAWAEFNAWVSANGHQTAVDLRECYVKGPESGDDASTYRTEFSRQILD